MGSFDYNLLELTPDLAENVLASSSLEAEGQQRAKDSFFLIAYPRSFVLLPAKFLHPLALVTLLVPAPLPWLIFCLVPLCLLILCLGLSAQSAMSGGDG